jgi:hypothetical protein
MASAVEQTPQQASTTSKIIARFIESPSSISLRPLRSPQFNLLCRRKKEFNRRIRGERREGGIEVWT